MFLILWYPLHDSVEHAFVLIVPPEVKLVQVAL